MIIRRRRLLALSASALLLANPILTACRPLAGSSRSITYGNLLEPNTLNPLLAPDVSSRQAIELTFDGLVAADDSYTLQPRLAERWDFSPDGKAWTFHLRKGVKFHDGQDLSADDVVFTYRTLLDPKSGATLARGDYTVVDRVEAVDASTVKFSLKQPYAPFLSRLTVGILPRRLLEGQDLTKAVFNRQPVGTGPYKLKEWQAGQRLTFEANADYHAGKPAVQEIVWKVVPDSSALTMQLLGGDLNAAPLADPQDRASVQGKQQFSLSEALGGATQISLRLTNPLFQDVRVRRALALGLDVPAIVSGVMHGAARLAVSDIPASSWAADPSLSPIQRDVDSARRLLGEAGWARGADGVYAREGRPFAFTLSTYAGDRLREAVALVVQQQWRELGLKVEVSTQERNSFVANRVLKGDFEAALLESSVQVDPDLSRRFHSASIKAGQNFLSYQNAELDALLDQAVATSDREARKQLYASAQRILLNDLPQIPLFYATTTYAFPSWLSGVRPTALGPFWNVAEWRA